MLMTSCHRRHLLQPSGFLPKFKKKLISLNMFTLWTLIEASLLCLNAVCVLHDERFLAKIGWGANVHQDFGEPTVKSQILNLVRSIRTVAKIPLIFLNIAAIVIKLVLG